ncbi:MAG: S1 family peptidase [Myxococcales bacterium FL481]|nr:MAG: S1 family peptidase [Myxococcales bacterium FL481]
MQRARLLAPVGLLAGTLAVTAAQAEVQPEPVRDAGPRIFGGTETQGCEFPSVAAVKVGSLCTGLLVHPRLVVYAAHCGDDDKFIHFGNSDTLGGKQVATSKCVVNPDYQDTVGQDWAYCKLTKDVKLPYTPPAMGCELDRVAPGANVMQVGYGANGGTHLVPTGAGIKRWGESTVADQEPNTLVVGGEGIGACPGDSGGPALIQLADGTWRTIGIASVMHSEDCGASNSYVYLPPAVAWIERDSGIDITPCHDADGTWNPTASCRGFLQGGDGSTPPGDPLGTWANWCESTPASGFGRACGEPYVPDPSEPTAVDDEDHSGDDDSGCGCGATAEGPWLGLAWLALIAARRRRD